MKVRALKYFLVASIASLCYSNLLAQEGGFIFNSEAIQESLEIPSSPGSEKVHKQTTGTDGEKKSNKQDPEQPKESKESTTSQKKESTKPVKTVAKAPENASPTSNPAIDTTNKEEDPDSVLSFNFLHYIIQRFKFSDVIDQ